MICLGICGAQTTTCQSTISSAAMLDLEAALSTHSMGKIAASCLSIPHQGLVISSMAKHRMTVVKMQERMSPYS